MRSQGLVVAIDGPSGAGKSSMIEAGVRARLEDPDEEQLRLVLHGDDAPANVPRVLGWGFLALFPDRPTQDEFKKLLGAVEKWSVEGPGAPPA